VTYDLVVIGLLRTGRFWMVFWIAVFATVVVWGVLTMLLWRNSITNLNALSIAALVIAVGAGLQSTLAMRKADREDDF
jgi:hypothetical protein